MPLLGSGRYIQFAVYLWKMLRDHSLLLNGEDAGVHWSLWLTICGLTWTEPCTVTDMLELYFVDVVDRMASGILNLFVFGCFKEKNNANCILFPLYSFWHCLPFLKIVGGKLFWFLNCPMIFYHVVQCKERCKKWCTCSMIIKRKSWTNFWKLLNQ